MERWRNSRYDRQRHPADLWSRMPHIELPRALEDYFAFTETTPTRNGRRFSITLPYLDGERLDRLQWWYHISPAQEQLYEGGGVAFFRARAIERFCRHIERWLEITAQRFHGDEPIPRLGSQQSGGRSATLPKQSTAPATAPLFEDTPHAAARVAANG